MTLQYRVYSIEEINHFAYAATGVFAYAMPSALYKALAALFITLFLALLVLLDKRR